MTAPVSVPGQVLTPLPREASRRLIGSVAGLLVTTVLAVSVVTTPQLLAPAAEGIRDAGLVSDLTAPVVRGLRVLAAVVTVGALVVALILGGSQRASAMKSAASRWAMLWAVAAGCSILLEVSQTSGVPISGVLSGEGSSFSSAAAQVTGLTVTAWLAASVSFFAHRVATPAGVRVVLLLAASALVAPVLTGHSGHSGFNLLALAALALHVVAVSAWAGGLVALCAHADAATRLDTAVLRRFSAMALVCYAVIALSGAANLTARLSLVELLTDGGAYAVLLVLKVSLFVLLGLIGLAHRRRTLGHVRDDATASSFWSLAVAEVAVMAAALGLAVSLTATAPGTPDGPEDDVHAVAPGRFTSA